MFKMSMRVYVCVQHSTHTRTNTHTHTEDSVYSLYLNVCVCVQHSKHTLSLTHTHTHTQTHTHNLSLFPVPQCLFPRPAGIECPPLSAPVHGAMSDCTRDLGATCSFTCSDGHLLDRGASMRTCQSNGEWDGNEPVCSREYQPRT